MARTLLIRALVLALIALPMVQIGSLRAQVPGTAEHEHMTEVACTEVAPGDKLPAAKSYSAVLSYAVMRPGDSSRVHTHPGPEGWYVIAGEQCLETPAGADRARTGGTMAVGPNIPMELNVTGATLRRAFALVIHDSAQAKGIPSNWKPSGACRR